jgi:hypothetical protein
VAELHADDAHSHTPAPNQNQIPRVILNIATSIACTTAVSKPQARNAPRQSLDTDRAGVDHSRG